MRAVETCDFCGDRARGLYEPLPASMADSPRFALCDGCRDRLASVVDPLLALVEDADGSRTDEPAGQGSPRDRRAPDGSGTSAATPVEEPAGEQGVGGSRDAGGREKDDRRGTPHGYRKVMRFLENRSLPVDRPEAEFLVSEAYDLEESAVAEAIDHAVQYGRLREVDGELKR